MSLGTSLLSFSKGLVGKDFRGESVGNLERKTTAVRSVEWEHNCHDEATIPPGVCSLMHNSLPGSIATVTCYRLHSKSSKKVYNGDINFLQNKVAAPVYNCYSAN